MSNAATQNGVREPDGDLMDVKNILRTVVNTSNKYLLSCNFGHEQITFEPFNSSVSPSGMWVKSCLDLFGAEKEKLNTQTRVTYLAQAANV